MSIVGYLAMTNAYFFFTNDTVLHFNFIYYAFQSFGNWPSDPPSLSVMDYSDAAPIPKPYYGESNIDTEDTSAHGSDIWKKSYGNDMTKVCSFYASKLSNIY